MRSVVSILVLATAVTGCLPGAAGDVVIKGGENDASGWVTQIDSDFLSDSPYAEQIAFQIDLEGRTFILDLERNDELFAPGYRELAFEGGEFVEHSFDAWAPAYHCWYIGSATDTTTGMETVAAIRTCDENGNETFTGTIRMDDTAFWIQPSTAPEARTLYAMVPSESTDPLHVPEEDERCGIELTRIEVPAPELGAADVDTGVYRAKRNEGTGEKWVELLVVNDKARMNDLGDTASRSSTDIVNMMSALYRAADFDPPIRITMTGQVHVNDNDPWDMPASGTADAEEVLRGFREWSTKLPSPVPASDKRQLFTHVEMDKRIVGLAPVGGMCWEPYSASIVRGDMVPPTSAAIAAHEMGHSFHADHDGVENTCDDAGHIMASRRCKNCPAESAWSACSIDAIDDFNQSHTSCLDNSPWAIASR